MIEILYVLILGIAVLLNLYQPRMLILTFLSIFFLLIIPLMLPDPDSLGVTWYVMLAALEMVFAGAAMLINAPASNVIVMLSIYNAIGHLSGILGWSYEGYPWVIMLGESCQALACLVLSRPVMMLLAQAAKKIKLGKNWDGWFNRFLEPQCQHTG